MSRTETWLRTFGAGSAKRTWRSTQWASGRRNETLKLYVPKYGHTVWDTRASVVEAEARRHLSPEVFWRFDDRRATVVASEVEIRRLDEFDFAPHIIKIDVEGTESDVIDGGFDTIRAHLPVIVVEGNGAQAVERLRPLGYQRHRFDPVSNVLIRDQAGVINTFLLREDHHGLFHLTRAIETAGDRLLVGRLHSMVAGITSCGRLFS